MNHAPFPYPGGKARHAEWIVEHIPEHVCYVEPFGGAGAVLFNKPPSTAEVYNDVDGDIVQFFEMLRDRHDDLVVWLERVPFARDVHLEWTNAFYNDGYRPDDPVERAGRFFYLRFSQWGSKYHGTSGFTVQPHRNTARGLKNRVDELDQFADRLRSVVIENADWREIVELYDSPDTVFYCDPPYMGTEVNYVDGDVDHRELHDTLVSIEGRAIVSHDAVPPFYTDDWQIVSKDATFKIDSVGGDKAATEYLLMNYDADGTPIMSDVGQQTFDTMVTDD